MNQKRTEFAVGLRSLEHPSNPLSAVQIVDRIVGSVPWS